MGVGWGAGDHIGGHEAFVQGLLLLSVIPT